MTTPWRTSCACCATTVSATATKWRSWAATAGSISVQAIVGKWLINDVHFITAKRIANADAYDRRLRPHSRHPHPAAPCRKPARLPLTSSSPSERDELLRHCLEHGIEAKVHYPIPLYQQQGLRQFGYKTGDFPVTDRHAREMITFPADEHLTDEQLAYIIQTVERSMRPLRG